MDGSGIDPLCLYNTTFYLTGANLTSKRAQLALCPLSRCSSTMDFGNDSRPMYRSFTDPMSYSLASCTGSATFQPLTFDAFPSFSAPAPETPPPRPSPPPPDTLARVSMRKKISELDHEDALDVLSALVERSPEAFRPVKDMLFPRKRARDAQLECESCAEMFCLEDEPGETTCRYHDGELSAPTLRWSGR